MDVCLKDAKALCRGAEVSSACGMTRVAVGASCTQGGLQYSGAVCTNFLMVCQHQQWVSMTVVQCTMHQSDGKALISAAA